MSLVQKLSSGYKSGSFNAAPFYVDGAFDQLILVGDRDGINQLVKSDL